MSRKLVLSLAGLVVAGMPALASASGARGPGIAVKPRTGSPKTSFVVSFQAPQRTGPFGSFQRHYVAHANGPAGAGRCVSHVSVSAPDPAATARVRVTLNPAQVGTRWCPGTFHGSIEEIQTPVCPKGKLCPAFVLSLKTVGTFSFRVRPASGDAKPPSLRGPGERLHVPGLDPHGSFDFIVRARDRAGNEDQNRVERRGIDPCV
jgi:hypothetical protein